MNSWNARIDEVEQEFKDRAVAGWSLSGETNMQNQSWRPIEAQVDLLNRGLGETMASLALLNSTIPQEIQDHIVAGILLEVDTLTVTAIPTVAGNITIKLINGVAKTITVDPAVRTTTALVKALIHTEQRLQDGQRHRNRNYTVTFTSTTAGARTVPINTVVTGMTASISGYY